MFALLVVGIIACSVAEEHCGLSDVEPIYLFQEEEIPRETTEHYQRIQHDLEETAEEIDFKSPLYGKHYHYEGKVFYHDGEDHRHHKDHETYESH